MLPTSSYVSLFAGITLPNAASVGLHEAMGFERLGVFRNVGYKNGSWRDVGVVAVAPVADEVAIQGQRDGERKDKYGAVVVRSTPRLVPDGVSAVAGPRQPRAA